MKISQGSMTCYAVYLVGLTILTFTNWLNNAGNVQIYYSLWNLVNSLGLRQYSEVKLGAFLAYAVVGGVVAIVIDQARSSAK